jgi:hypothetical protein
MKLALVPSVEFGGKSALMLLAGGWLRWTAAVHADNLVRDHLIRGAGPHCLGETPSGPRHVWLLHPVLPGVRDSENEAVNACVCFVAGTLTTAFYSLRVSSATTSILFAYEILTPAALNFFVEYSNGAVESLWSIDQYFEFVVGRLLPHSVNVQKRSAHSSSSVISFCPRI